MGGLPDTILEVPQLPPFLLAMIVLDDENTPDVKRPPARHAPGEEMSESSQLIQGPPPAYSASGSHGTEYNSPLQSPDDVSTSNRRFRLVRGENARNRFLRAFAVAVGIWLLIVIIAESIEEINLTVKRVRVLFKRASAEDSIPPESPDEWPPKPGKRIRFPFCPVAPSGNSTQEISPSSDPNSVKVGFSIPASSEFSFFGNDSYSYGSFAVDAVESSTSDVEVDIVISGQNRDILQRSKICLFEEGAKHTIGIMAAKEEHDPPSTANLLRYDVYVKLPIPEKRPLFVPRLSAYFSLFAIATMDLAGRVEFGELDLRTEDMIIVVESLSARRARLETSQKSIKGSFTTSSSLELVTKNAPIQADIVMLNSASSDQPLTQLALHTKNAVISARLNLTNPSTSSSHLSSSPGFSDDSIGGNFSIESTTSNAANSISVLSQPFSSHLSLTAHTSNAACEVFLPHQFSGGFRLSSSIMQPVLQVTSPPIDKKNRNREVDLTRRKKNLLEGTVSWFNGRGKKESGGGFVDVATSVLPAILNL
ncbi:hypothetical protein ACEPAF_5515 [Sanghuangporus sanghuang]